MILFSQCQLTECPLVNSQLLCYVFKDISSELSKASEYLEGYVPTLEQNTTDSMTVAIVTYALVRFNSQQMHNANTALKKRMIFDEGLIITCNLILSFTNSR